MIKIDPAIHGLGYLTEPNPSDKPSESRVVQLHRRRKRERQQAGGSVPSTFLPEVKTTEEPPRGRSHSAIRQAARDTSTKRVRRGRKTTPEGAAPGRWVWVPDDSLFGNQVTRRKRPGSRASSPPRRTAR